VYSVGLWAVLAFRGGPVTPAQIGGVCLGHFAGAFLGLAAQRVQQADLHVEDDALQLHCVEVIDQRVGRSVAGDQLLPQRHSHCRTVGFTPTQEGRACASGLLCQLHGQQVEGVGVCLRQNVPLRQLDQVVAQGMALTGPFGKRPLTFKRL